MKFANILLSTLFLILIINSELISVSARATHHSRAYRRLKESNRKGQNRNNFGRSISKAPWKNGYNLFGDDDRTLKKKSTYDSDQKEIEYLDVDDDDDEAKVETEDLEVDDEENPVQQEESHKNYIFDNNIKNLHDFLKENKNEEIYDSDEDEDDKKHLLGKDEKNLSCFEKDSMNSFDVFNFLWSFGFSLSGDVFSDINDAFFKPKITGYSDVCKNKLVKLYEHEVTEIRNEKQYEAMKKVKNNDLEKALDLVITTSERKEFDELKNSTNIKKVCEKYTKLLKNKKELYFKEVVKTNAKINFITNILAKNITIEATLVSELIKGNAMPSLNEFVKNEILKKFEITDEKLIINDKKKYLNQLRSVLEKDKENLEKLMKVVTEIDLDRSCEDLPESIVEIKECIDIYIIDNISAGVALVKNRNIDIINCLPKIFKGALISMVGKLTIKLILGAVLTILTGFYYTIFVLAVKLAIIIRYIYLAYQATDVGERSGYIGLIAGIIVRSLINPNSKKMRKMRKFK
jgi:hypothetical protein